MSELVHTRFICNSQLLFEEIEKAGFIEGPSEGHYLKKIRKFYKGKKAIFTSLKELVLLEKAHISKMRGKKYPDIIDGMLVVYRGYSIHDQTFYFFSDRNLIEIKKEEN